MFIFIRSFVVVVVDATTTTDVVDVLYFEKVFGIHFLNLKLRFDFLEEGS